jgi:hypothetical protein
MPPPTQRQENIPQPISRHFAIVEGCFLVFARGLEFLYVSAGAEGFAACAANDDAAQICIAVTCLHSITKIAPHSFVHGIEPFRLV